MCFKVKRVKKKSNEIQKKSNKVLVVKLDKPKIKCKIEEKCEHSLPNDSSNQKEKPHAFKKKEKSVSHEIPFKI